MKSNSLERTIRTLKVWHKKAIAVNEYAIKNNKGAEQIDKTETIAYAFGLVVQTLKGVNKFRKNKSNKQ